MDNHQYTNVGNIGDILKHAALVELLGLLQSRYPGRRIRYLDTHAFVLRAPLADPAWRSETARLLDAWPSYRAYVELQSECVQGGDYACSGGLAARVLRRGEFFFSEYNAGTRRELRRQIDEDGIASAQVLSDIHAWPTVPRPGDDAPLMALVDPFALSAPIWQAACAAVRHLHGGGCDGALEVFTYRKSDGEVDWPAPPDGWTGPVARIDRRPYFMALYATPAIAGAAASTVGDLGWRAPARA